MEQSQCKTFLESRGITDHDSLRKWMLTNHPDKIKGFHSLNQNIQDQHNALFSQVCNYFKTAFQDQELNSAESCPLPPKANAADCVRQVANWAKIQKHHRFDSINYDITKTNLELPVVSPKMRQLFDIIRQLDNNDIERENKVFKHFIFSDLQGQGHGSKIIASALISEGFSPIFRDTFDQGIRFKRLQDVTPFQTFGLISSTCVFGKAFDDKTKKQMLSIYNDRNENVHGKNMRILIMDSKFKEGIDLYDVKYLHIFEEPKNSADYTQVIGRATRYCGQKGLNFVKDEGWKLHVYIYKLYYTLPAQPGNRQFLFNDYKRLRINNVDMDEGVFMENVEKLAMLSAVDYELNFEMHRRVVGDEDMSDAPPPQVTNEMDELAKKFEKLSINNNQLINMSVKDVQKQVLMAYKQFKYGPIVVQDACNVAEDYGRLIKLTNTQQFVANYLRPESEQKGMLLWHSVGTGKTCTAIAVKSYFEMSNDTPFHVLWVTKVSLLNLEQKNMYDSVCHAFVREQIRRSGNGVSREELVNRYMQEIRRKGLIIQTLTYRQFSNALTGQNDLGRLLTSKNGTDMLRKTLVIIDEAHKLYADDFTEQEKPNVKIITEKIHFSYTHSKKDSCKVLLMTATPMVNGVTSFVNLMNLIIEKETDRFDIATFRQKLCTPKPSGHDCSIFSEEGKKYFTKRVAGLISYLNRRYDPSLFAQPEINTIEVEMSRVPEHKTDPYCRNYINNRYQECKKRVMQEYEQNENNTSNEVEQLSIALRNIEKKLLQNKEKIDELKNAMKSEDKASDMQSKEKIAYYTNAIKQNEAAIASLRQQQSVLNAQLQSVNPEALRMNREEDMMRRESARQLEMEKFEEKKKKDMEKANDKLQKCILQLEEYNKKMSERTRPMTDKMKETQLNKERAIALCRKQIEDINQIITTEPTTNTKNKGKAPIAYDIESMDADNSDMINQITDSLSKIERDIRKIEQQNIYFAEQIELNQIQYAHPNERYIQGLQDEMVALNNEKARLLPLLKAGPKSSKPNLSSCDAMLKDAHKQCDKLQIENEIYQDVGFNKCMQGTTTSVSSSSGGKNLIKRVNKKNKVIKKKTK